MWLTAAKGKGVEVLGIIVRIINLISSAALVVTIAMKSVILLISRGKQEVVFLEQEHFLDVKDRFTWIWHSTTKPCKPWETLQSSSIRTGGYQVFLVKNEAHRKSDLYESQVLYSTLLTSDVIDRLSVLPLFFQFWFGTRLSAKHSIAVARQLLRGNFASCKHKYVNFRFEVQVTRQLVSGQIYLVNLSSAFYIFPWSNVERFFIARITPQLTRFSILVTSLLDSVLKL